MDADAVTLGSTDELHRAGQLVGKVGDLPVVVFWDGGRAWAVEDRCPHMGFPLHRGTVDDGLLTCHWHHARLLRGDALYEDDDNDGNATNDEAAVS